MKLILKCSFSPLVSEAVLKELKKASGLDDLEYDDHALILYGGKDQIFKALGILSSDDLVTVDFPNCVSDSLYIKTIKSAFRKAKTNRLASLLRQADLPDCLGHMPWRFTTPRTTTEQDRGTVSALTACISCNLSDICFQFSALQKLEELKWYKDTGNKNDG